MAVFWVRSAGGSFRVTTIHSGLVHMRRVTKADFDFSHAAEYRKMEPLAKSHVRVATLDEEVISRHSAGVEAKNIARAGDYIISGSVHAGAYVIQADRFAEIYEQDPIDPNFYRNTMTRKGVLTLDDVVFMAPWGEEQNVVAGSMIIEAGDDIYGIDKLSFIRKYGRVDANPQKNVFCRVSDDLPLQKRRADELGLANHLHDIALRLANPGLFA